MSKAQIIELPKIPDERGNLSFIEQFRHVPFEIKRAYWIYDVPGGESRTGRALKATDEVIVALSGSFDVVIESGERYQLNRSYYGLYLPAGTWRQLENFSTNSLALVLASEPYDESDYVYDHD